MTHAMQPNGSTSGCGCSSCNHCIPYNVNPDPLTAKLTGGFVSALDDSGHIFPPHAINYTFGAVQVDETARWYLVEPFYAGEGTDSYPRFLLRNNCCDSVHKCTLAVLSRFDNSLIGPGGFLITLDDDAFNPALHNILAKWEWTCESPTWNLVYWSGGAENSVATFVGLTNTA